MTPYKLYSLLFVGMILLSFQPMKAQPATSEGVITPEMIKQFKTELEGNNQTTAIRNAVTSTSIRQLTQNFENKGNVDDYFSDKIKIQGITDQKSSGRCWLFTGLNVMRVLAIEKNNMKEFYFSQNYSFFFDQLEKANLFLEAVIETAKLPTDDRKVEWLLKNPIADGGIWSNFVGIVQKYGVVPSSVMPDSKQAESTSALNNVLTTLLRKNALELRHKAQNKSSEKELRTLKKEMLSDVYRVLSLSLGEPPQSFEWRYEDADGKISPTKKYTPQSFFKEFIQADLNDFVQFMDDPSRDYYKTYEIEYDRNTTEGINCNYLNIPVQKIKQAAIASIKNGEAMYFSCDVGKQLEKESGILDLENFDSESLFDVTLEMSKADRIRTFESSSSHGMTLCGVDLNEEGKPNKWLVENSWGKSGHDGFLIITDRWFDEYMFRLVINKKYIEANILKLFEQKPILLPAWDPMFAPVN